MATLTVTSTPQAIYPDGLQDVFTITNDGPWTVYLDSDSSVSEASSYPLPATATIVWDAERPLWAVCAGAHFAPRTVDSVLSQGAPSSSIRMTRNSTPSDASRAAVDSVLLRDVFNSIVPVTLYSSQVFECSSYNSILINIDCPNYIQSPPDNNHLYRIELIWFSLSGDQIESNFLTVPYQVDTNPMVVRAPVKGAYCRVDVLFPDQLTPPHPFNLFIQGTSRIYLLGWTFTSKPTLFNTFTNYPAFQSTLSPVWSEDFWGVEGYLGENVFLSALRPIIQVSLRITGTPSAGTSFLRLLDYGGLKLIHEVAISATANQTLDFTAHIPTTYPLRVSISVPANISGTDNRLSLVFSDV